MAQWEVFLRIVYYTHTAFLEPALSLIHELSRRAEVHLLLEVGPGAWQTASFDLARRLLPAGLVPADEVLRDAFPEAVRVYWQSTASFNLVIHQERRSLHPNSWKVSRQVIEFVTKLAPTVFHVDDVDVSPRLALALRGLRRIPLVLNVHDPVPHSGESNWRKDLSRRLSYGRATQFVLHNHRLKDSFCQSYQLSPERVHVVRLGVYELFNAWSAASTLERDATILFFGRLSPYKGLDVLYAAMRHVARHVPGVRLVVAGRPIPGYQPPPPPLLGEPAIIDVVDRYLTNAELARLNQEASLVVCPYLDATQSGVVLTAYAFGNPVVASDVGGLTEYVVHGETGWLVPAGDPEALASALTRLLRDAPLRAQLRQGVKGFVQRELGWDRVAEEMLAVYRYAGG